ncbi:MAG TPA: DMT family transporter [Hyphomonadaceae bacterium]|jgi:drug/metabolite transporter (DMT)-like permease|nr:DMT family transporter [Hyphomonadaceae bacterium]
MSPPGEPAAQGSTRPWLGPLLVTCGAIAIGYAPIGLRLSEFGPQATAFWRFAFALPLILAVIYGSGGKLEKPSMLSLVAGLFFGFDIVFWHASLVLTSVANATFLVNLGNAAVGVVAWIVLKERPGKTWGFAIAIALVGALLLSRGAAGETAGAVQGDLLALLAAIMVGLYLFFAKLARRTSSAMNVLFWSTATTLAVTFFAALLRNEPMIPPEPGWLVVPLTLAIFAHVLGQGLIVAGVGRTPAALAGILLLIQPVAAGLIAWPLFREMLTPLQIFGACLILAGVWLGEKLTSGQR